MTQNDPSPHSPSREHDGVSAQDRGELLDVYLENVERLETGLLALGVDACINFSRIIKKIKVARFDAKHRGIGCPPSATCKADEV